MKARFTTEGGLPILHRHRETFWIWKDNYYNIVGDEIVESALWRFLQNALKKGKKGAIPFGPKRGHVSDSVGGLRAICQLDPFIELPTWLQEKEMPPASEFLVCGNGLLHVPSRTLYQSTADYFCVSASKVFYDEDAPAPTQWLRYLDDVLADDEALQLAQEWIGYLLVPDTSQQKILYCEGPKRSGKGTFARVITALLGKDSVGGPTMNSLAESFGLEPLITKPVAIISDARIGAQTNKSAVVERLLSISGEDTMSVNRKNKQHWNGTLPTRFIIMTNEAPALMEGSGALAGRLLGLMFQHSFYGREDMELTRKLTQDVELSGILNWAIDGYVRLRQRGRFVQPRNAVERIEEIEILGAPVKAFIKDECETGPGLRIHTDVLFDRFKRWNERNGQSGHAGSKNWFSRNLCTALPGVVIKRLGPQGIEGTFYMGIGLQTSDPADVRPSGDIPF
jgi:putative DNA primase/helicase